ncbi:MAG: phage polymerase-related protein [Caulobacter sp.]|nr:phage polymerase-related protein [Caulobacter sp.]
MRVVRLATETDFEGWRAAARALRLEGLNPEAVVWTVDGAEPDLLSGGMAEAGAAAPGLGAPQAALTVPRGFMELAGAVVLHRSAERFALLYRLLWRLQKQPRLLEVTTDIEVAKARAYAHAVGHAAHKMKAFVRFRLVEDAAAAPDGIETFAAWFEPPHRVAERTAPFFARRFSNMRFSILTPDACVHWDTERLRFTPGADPADAPSDDALEDYWRTYYASTFNPARLKVKSMTSHMPKLYWRNLPEASLIPELVAGANDRTARMVAAAPTPPSIRTPSQQAMKAAARIARDGAWEMDAPGDLEALAAGVHHCRRCDLWRDATQGVRGEGPDHAPLMFVGEQPGDQEDLAGRPFVGPAGQVFNKALAEAGVPRDKAYVTNAVKHFKHEPRGKRRLHKTPDRGEVQACRWWLDHERRLIRPRVVVALGATAALAVFGKTMPIGANRGHAIQLPDQSQGVITWHPSFLLRTPDPEEKAKAYAAFVDDLKFAWGLVA